MRTTENIEIEINGVSYRANAKKITVKQNEKILIDKTVLVENCAKGRPELKSLSQGEKVEILDKTGSGNYSGKYQYFGSTYREYIFELKE